jgi:methionyl-tRNA formyltransferase
MTSVFLFGNQGYASLLMPELIKQDLNVVGICSRPAMPMKKRLRIGAGKLLRQLHLRSDEGFSRPGPFHEFAMPARLSRGAGIACFSSREIRSEHFLSKMSVLEPDIVLVAGFHRLIPKSIYEQAKVAAINFHPSLLPYHRGGTPNRWVIRNGERKTGITAHLLSEEFDTGDIVGQCTVDVSARDTWGDVELKLANRIISFAIEIVAMAMSDDLVPYAQNLGQGSYENSFGGADRWISWRLSAAEIRQICYAIRPKSGGLASFRGQFVCLWDVEALNNESKIAAPGTIIALTETGAPIVSCGTGAAQLNDFLQHGRVISAKKLHQDLNWRVGDKFD